MNNIKKDDCFHVLSIFMNVYFDFLKNEYLCDEFDIDDWLNTRINIFKNTTLKSIQNQTNKNFECWLFMCKDFCNKSNLNKIEELQEFFDIRTIFLPKKSFNKKRDFIPLIQKYCKNKNYLITTALDSDDLIHKNFINEIQINTSYDFEDIDIIYLPNGYHYVYGENILRKERWIKNQTFSVIEKIDKPVLFTCRGYREKYTHTRFFDDHRKKCRIIENKIPMWIYLQSQFAGPSRNVKYKDVYKVFTKKVKQRHLCIDAQYTEEETARICKDFGVTINMLKSSANDTTSSNTFYITKNNYALVSIRMPTYNSEKYIEESIKCILKDIYPNKELIIVDDGSIDNTKNIIQKYMSCPFIKAIFLEKNQGNPHAVNVATENCSGDIIAKLDSDDIQDVSRITKSVKHLETNENDLVTCKAKFMDENGKLVEHRCLNNRMIPDRFMNLKMNNNPVNASIVGWKSFFDKVGPLRENYKTGSDGVWNIKAVLSGGRWGFIDEHLYYYRCHEKQMHYFETSYLVNKQPIPKGSETGISTKIRQLLKQGKNVDHLL